MAAQLDFAVGAAVILVPHYGIPAFIGSSVGKLLLNKRRKKTMTPEGNSSNTEKQQVQLEWSHVGCQLTTKNGETQQLLKDQSGVARPERHGLDQQALAISASNRLTMHIPGMLQASVHLSHMLHLVQALGDYGPIRIWKDNFAQRSGRASCSSEESGPCWRGANQWPTC